MSFQHAGSQFVRDLINIAELGCAGWVQNVVNSTLFDQIDAISLL